MASPGLDLLAAVDLCFAGAQAKMQKFKNAPKRRGPKELEEAVSRKLTGHLLCGFSPLMEPELLSRLLQAVWLPRVWKILPRKIFVLLALPSKKAKMQKFKNTPKLLASSKEGKPALKMIVLTCQHINRLFKTYLGQL